MPDGILLAAAPPLDALTGPGGTAWWLYLLASAGIGGAVGAVTAAGLTLIGGQLQRRYDRRSKWIEDQSHLRDARLERLRADFSEVTTVALAITTLIREGTTKAQLETIEVAMNRFRSASSRLLLDPDGPEVADSVEQLHLKLIGVQTAVMVAEVRSVIHPTEDIAEAAQVAHEVKLSLDEMRREVQAAAERVIAKARQLLLEIEQTPSFEDAP